MCVILFAMDARKKVVIGLRLEGTSGRRILTGVLHYLDTAGDWDIRFAYGAQELRRMLPGADGVLVDHLSEAFDGGLETSAPVVHFNTMKTSAVNRRHAFVHVDNGAIGFTAARYFLGLSPFCSFGFVPAHGDRFWSKRRGEAFTLYLKDHGRQALSFDGSSDDPEEDVNRLARWIRDLPKPAALFAAWDGRAVEVLDACRRAHADVPRQVVVLGVDNDEISCEHASPPLSSIAPDTENGGFAGAKLLDRMMREKASVRTRSILSGIKGIVERASTHPPPPAVQLVRRALDFIDANATSGITPDDVARRLGISRSLLNLRFRELEGFSVGDRLREARLTALARLLRQTRRSVADLTRECGFRNVNAAKETFRRTFGLSMRAYRHSTGEEPVAVKRIR